MPELKIYTFDEIAGEEVRWLWKPYIPFGKITVIQGDSGNGKTTLALAIAELVSWRGPMGKKDFPIKTNHCEATGGRTILRTRKTKMNCLALTPLSDSSYSKL